MDLKRILKKFKKSQQIQILKQDKKIYRIKNLVNIVETEMPFVVEAKTSNCKNQERNISYQFIESAHSLCFDKREETLAYNIICEMI